MFVHVTASQERMADSFATNGTHTLLDERLERAWDDRAVDPARTRLVAAELLAEARAEGRSGAVAAALRIAAWGALSGSDFASARDLAEEALRYSRASGNRSEEALAGTLLARALIRLGESTQAHNLCNDSLAAARAVGDRAIEAMALNALGIVCADTGEYTAAMEHHRHALAIAEDLEMGDDVAQALLGMGNACESMADYRAALGYYERALATAERIGHLQLEAYATGNIGLTYERIGDVARSLAYELRSLELKERIGDRWGAGVSLNNIGLIYKALGDYARALEHLLRALEYAERIGDRSGEMIALHNIGHVYESLGDRKLVLDHYQRMLRIAEEIGDKRGEAFALGDAGRFFTALGDHRQALLHMLRGLRMHQEIGDRFGERSALDTIAEIYTALGDLDRAHEHAAEALRIAETIEDRRGVIDALERLGIVESARGDHERAIELLDRALGLARESEYADDIITVARALADAHRAAGDIARSRVYERLREEQARQLFNAEQTLRSRQLIAGFEQKVMREKARSLGLGAEDLDALIEIDAAKRGASASYDAPRDEELTHAQPSPSIIVQTFGELRVVVDGRALRTADWGRRKARDLFKFLLVHHRRTVTMDELIEKLWDGMHDRSTELLVMNAVSRIRKALEPERSPRDRRSMLSSADGTYRLDLGDDAEIDFMRFKELIVVARRAHSARERYEGYERAAALYTDDFLKEDYDAEWTLAERELLKDAFLEALEYLAGEQLREGRHDEAGETARRLLTFDSTCERGYEVLIRSLLARGRSSEAQQVYDDCRLAFRRELDAEPPSSLRSIIVQ